MDLTGKGDYEYVSGYLGFDINTIAIVNSSGGLVQTAKVRLLNFTTKDNKKIHPISKAGNQLLRTDLQSVVLNNGIKSSGKPINVIKSLLGPLTSDIGSIILGFDKMAVKRGYNKRIDLTRSWFRTANPNYKKFGGGSRVKSISLYDNWNSMDNYSQSNVIKQEYIYETTHVVSGTEQQISSGVASWEPALGGEENLHKTPISFSEERLLAPSNYHYIEKPIGEMLFPSPSVGYSEVKVRNITSRNNGSSNGYSIYKFYTARDFPTITKLTAKKRIPVVSLPTLALFFSYKYHHENASQGFVVETNDMHGKQKEVSHFNESDALISSTIYEYDSQVSADGKTILNNEVAVIYPNGTKGVSEIGVDIDVWQSFDQENTENYSAGVAINVDWFFAFIFPIIVPVPIPSFHTNIKRLRTSITTKHVHRTGILKKVTNIKNGSSISSDNLYFDSNTGHPLITKTQNEFKDPHYQTTYPAHWAYQGMGQASQNQNLKSNLFVLFGSKFISDSAICTALNEGDEVVLYENVGDFESNNDIPMPGKYYVGKSENNCFLIDENGNNFTREGAIRMKVKVITPGKKNLQNNPIYQMTSFDDPMAGTSINVPFDKRYLDMSVQTYSSEWQINNISKRQYLCEVDSMIGDTIYPKLLDALLISDEFWEAKNIDLLTIIKTVFPDQTDDLWRGKLLSETLYNSLIPGFGIHENFYNYYYAYIGDCFFSISPSLCALSRPAKAEMVQNEVPEPIPCSPFNIDSLIYSECFNYSGPGIVLGNDGIYCRYIALLECKKCIENFECVEIEDGEIFNPFNSGMLNKWGPYQSYVHHTDRNYNASTTSIVNNEGHFNPTNSFWTLQSGIFKKNPALSQNWVETNRINKVDRKGNQLESTNALDIPSSAIFGYGNSVQKAVVKNSKLNDFAMECFEDWAFKGDCIESECYDDEHFDFYSAANVNSRFFGLAHTGKYSIAVSPSTPISECRILKPIENGVKYDITDYEYLFRKDGALPKFVPEYNNKRYVVSVWIGKPGIAPSSGELQVKINNTSCCNASGSTITLSPSGPIIDGWQRIYGVIELPGGTPCPDGTNSIEFIFKSNVGGNLFDDFRFHPVQASMQTYVYDHQNMRVSAILDENNYATFYEYDDVGNLVRIKKETEKGIMTLQEGYQRLVTEN